MRIPLLILLIGPCILLLAGCTTPSSLKKQSTSQKLSSAAVTPLKDLNLVKEEIPGILKKAQAERFSHKNENKLELSCKEIINEISEIHEILGPLQGEPKLSIDYSLVDRGYATAENALVSTVEGTTDVLPFKGFIKKLSGADRYAKKVQTAIEAGKVRKAFLIGLSTAKKCTDELDKESELSTKSAATATNAYAPN